MKKMTSLILSMVALISACSTPKHDLQDGLYAELKTNKGEILVQLEFEKTPVTVANFVSLAEGNNPFVDDKFKGKPYYDGLKFHRVINDFMIQGGDPDGTGAGGPGYVFKDEFDTSLTHNEPGILSMANAGPTTNGSQFFITHKETPWLDNMHTVFGHTIKGMEIVNTIAQDDVIEKVTIIRVGKEAKKFDAVKTFKNYFEQDAKDKKTAEANLAKAQEKYAKLFKESKAKATTTESGLAYYILEKGSDQKPMHSQDISIDYSGFFEDGRLFDSSNADISKEFNVFNQQRANANQYIPIPFKFGSKQGLIPGFIEGIEQMNMGDKALIFIPSHLAYGDRGAGNVIPPNTDLVFELHLIK